MFLEDLLPSQDTLFELACNALQAGSVPSFTPSNTPTIQILEINQSSNWEGLFRPQSLPIVLLIFLLMPIGFAISIVISKFILEPCFPNLRYRKAELIGIVLIGISMIGIVLMLTLVHQGFGSIFLFIPFIIIFLVPGIAFQHFSRIFKYCLGITNFIVSIILVFIAAHVFPQQLFHTCTGASLYLTFLLVLNVGMYLALVNIYFFKFHLILNSEKLRVSYSVKGKKYKGYIVKKGSEWVEVLTEDVFNV